MSDDFDRNTGSTPERDSYELAYEQQLRNFTDPDNRAPTVPVENLSGRDYEQHPNRIGRGSRGNIPGRRSAKGRKRSKVKTKQSHIDRSEPLRFGQNHASGAAQVKKRSPVKKIIIILLTVFLLFIVFVNIMIFRYIGKINKKETGTRRFTTASVYSDDVLNILVIGSDARDSSQPGRTDSMILLSFNKKSEQTTLTSFMRDSYVMLPEYDLDGDGSMFGEGDKCRLNAAYVYGGPELLMDTIQYNFDIRVDRYIYVDFFSFIDIVDSVGGIELDITDEEADGMRAPMYEQNKILGNPWKTDYLPCGGKGIRVNGNQALGYARLRYVGNADFQRTERQRIVISQLMKKVSGLGLFDKDKFACALCKSITTNLSSWELYKLILRAPSLIKYETKQLRIPGDKEYSYAMTPDGASVLEINFSSCTESLYSAIYG